MILEEMGFSTVQLRLKRGARFFFYSKQIIQIFLSVFSMTYQHPHCEYIISFYLPSLIIYRQSKSRIIAVPSEFCIILMFAFIIW